MDRNSTTLIDSASVIAWQGQNIENVPRLHAGELHLWIVKLELQKEQSAQALSWLNDTQRDRYHRRETELQKQSYLAGRYYLFKLLAQYSGTPCEEIELSYSRLNKPYLNSDENLGFNFTDTALENTTYGLFAFARNHHIGVDLESLDRSAKFTAIAEKRFTDIEKQYCYGGGSEIIKERFLAIWTRKEAYGKATARGINYSMKERNLYVKDSADYLFSDQQSRWVLHQLELQNKMVCAVVYSGTHTLPIKGYMPNRVD